VNLLLILLPVLPAVMALGALSGLLGPRGTTCAVLVTSALALVLAGVGADGLHLDWLLLGTSLGLDATGRALLAVAALVWGAAAISSRPLFAGEAGPRYSMCFLLTLAANLGVLIAQDVAAFYVSFAVMTYAAYGLVVHDGTDEAVRAGRIYLVLSVAGECLLLSGMFLLAAEAGNATAAEMGAAYAVLTHPELVAGLLLAGFAVKMGILPLHVWLPLAHPAAPVPASAVLSGLIVKGGLLGWLRFLPDGEPALVLPGDVLAMLGLAGAVLAALIGCFQHRAKTVLAYSTVSQMGLLALPVGLLVAGRGEAALLIPVIALFAVHHALAKGALFLAMDHLKGYRPLLAAVTVLPVLALVGAPFTSGLVAKGALKSVMPDALATLVTLSSVTTTLLLLRFLVLAWPRRDSQTVELRRVAVAAWLLLIAAGLVLPWAMADAVHRDYAFQPGVLRDAVWPLLAGMIVAAVAARAIRPWWRFPEGDVVAPVERLLIRVHGALAHVLEDVLRAVPGPPQRLLSRSILSRLLGLREPGIPWVGLQLLALILLLPVLYLLAA